MTITTTYTCDRCSSVSEVDEVAEIRFRKDCATHPEFHHLCVACAKDFDVFMGKDSDKFTKANVLVVPYPDLGPTPPGKVMLHRPFSGGGYTYVLSDEG